MRVEAHIAELEALLQLCASVPLHAYSENHIEWPASLYYLVDKSSVYMEHTLVRAGVPVLELRCLLAWEGVPLCGASRELAVSRWMDLHSNSVGRCCVDALRGLQSLLQQPHSWDGWHGVVLAKSVDMTSVATLPCPDILHTHRVCPLWVRNKVVDVFAPSALRSARVAELLSGIITTHTMCARTTRAELLLPLVSRFVSDCILQRDRVHSQEHSNCQPRSSTVATGYSTTRSPSLLVDNTPETSSLDTALNEAARVPLSLRRDYVIVATLWHTLASNHTEPSLGPSYISCASLASATSGIITNVGDKYLLQLTSIKHASLCQAASVVMRKIASIAAGLEGVSEARYGTNLGTRSRGLSFSRNSRLAMTTLMRKQMDGMLPPNSLEFALQWHTSRFSKSRAKTQISRLNSIDAR